MPAVQGRLVPRVIQARKVPQAHPETMVLLVCKEIPALPVHRVSMERLAHRVPQAHKEIQELQAHLAMMALQERPGRQDLLVVAAVRRA